MNISEMLSLDPASSGLGATVLGGASDSSMGTAEFLDELMGSMKTDEAMVSQSVPNFDGESNPGQGLGMPKSNKELIEALEANSKNRTAAAEQSVNARDIDSALQLAGQSNDAKELNRLVQDQTQDRALTAESLKQLSKDENLENTKKTVFDKPLVSSRLSQPKKKTGEESEAALAQIQGINLQTPVMHGAVQANKEVNAALKQALAQRKLKLGELKSVENASQGVETTVSQNVDTRKLTDAQRHLLGNGKNGEQFKDVDTPQLLVTADVVHVDHSPDKKIVRSSEEFVKERENLLSDKKKVAQLDQNSKLNSMMNPDRNVGMSELKTPTPLVSQLSVDDKIGAAMIGRSALPSRTIKLAQSAELASQVNALAAKGGGTVRLRIVPENLGEVVIQVKSETDKTSSAKNAKNIDVQFEVGNAEAGRLINERLGELQQKLTDQKYSVSKLEVKVSGVPGSISGNVVAMADHSNPNSSFESKREFFEQHYDSQDFRDAQNWGRQHREHSGRNAYKRQFLGDEMYG
ncbi:MAG: flagellar hook-length control protein FliK [Bacteriovoracia bacterium]